MSRRLPLASAAAAALALALVAPTAALADDHGQHGQHGSQAKDGDGHNPPGNNGTIKIDYPAPADSGHANRPHPGCAFQLRMFDFDKDQYGSITFVGQSPTKLGTLLTQQHVLLSNDPAGGGQDVDETYSYTAEQLGLTGKPQAKQGWHVKVLVDADNAPGGAKQKVFWLSCPAATSSTAAPTAGGSTAGTTTTTPAQESAGQGAAGTATTTTAVSGGSTAGAATASKGAGQASAFTGGSGSAALTASRPAAQNRGSALPFTGVALGTMVAVALAALAAGALAVRAGRRRTTEV